MNSSRPAISRPPREVPLSTKLVVLFGSQHSVAGWATIAFGMVFVWLFALNADWSSLFSFRGALETAPGIITASEKTNISEGPGGSRTGRRIRSRTSGKGTPIFAHQFKFSFGGVEHTETSYSTGGGLRDNQAVTVEFPAGKPTVSRIRGMRRGMFDKNAALVVIVPAVGLVMVLRGLLGGRKAIRLLANGDLAQGRLTDKTILRAGAKKKPPVMKLTFEFTDALGQLQQAVVKTSQTERLEDNPFETIFYDPQNPKISVLLDSIPGEQGFDSEGQIKTNGKWRMLAALVFPVLATAVVAVGF